MAVNESGVSALGAERLEQLLGTSIAALLPRTSATRCWCFSRASLREPRVDRNRPDGADRHPPHDAAPRGAASGRAGRHRFAAGHAQGHHRVATPRAVAGRGDGQADRAGVARTKRSAPAWPRSWPKPAALGKAAEADEVAELERKLAEAAELSVGAGTIGTRPRSRG